MATDLIPNRFAGPCAVCGGRVPAGAGIYGPIADLGPFTGREARHSSLAECNPRTKTYGRTMSRVLHHEKVTLLALVRKAYGLDEVPVRDVRSLEDVWWGRDGIRVVTGGRSCRIARDGALVEEFEIPEAYDRNEHLTLAMASGWAAIGERVNAARGLATAPA